jgi:pimeloyl-ACP methyl ester carboxylesterase
MPSHRTSGLVCVVVAALGAIVVAQPSPSRQIRANNTDLSCVEQGKGTPVVFVHGAVSDLRFWDSQRAQFAKQYRFVAYTRARRVEQGR